MKVIVLSVHYKYPALLRDQSERIGKCSAVLLDAANAGLLYRPIVHGASAPAVIEIARTLQGIVLPATPTTSASAHGDSLAQAWAALTASGEIQDPDLVAVMDHDAHPLDTGLFAVLAEKFAAQSALAGIGIPQWHRGHCFLHPSFLIARAEVIRRMGADHAFRMHMPADGQVYWDVCEGLSRWCRANNLPTRPLRVNGTRFPWSRWDSDRVPDGGAEFMGEHGEPVHVGNLMSYGLAADRSLISHVWAAPLKRRPGLSRLKSWLAGRTPGLADDFNEQEVLAEYLAEPLA